MLLPVKKKKRLNFELDCPHSPDFHSVDLVKEERVFLFMSSSHIRHLFERSPWWHAEKEFPCAISAGTESEFLCIDKPKGHNKLFLSDIMPKQEKENTFLYLIVFAAGVG